MPRALVLLLLTSVACRPAADVGPGPRPVDSDAPLHTDTPDDAHTDDAHTDTPPADCPDAAPDAFDLAAAATGVPADLLRAVARVETGGRMVEGHVEFPGRPRTWGVMALPDDRVDEAARLAGVTPEAARRHLPSNVLAAAALLAAWAREEGVMGAPLDAWAPVVARWARTGSPEATAAYVHHGVYEFLRRGGGFGAVVLPPRKVSPAWPEPPRPLRLDDPGAIWRPSPNYNSRGGRNVELVVVHSCEGSYASCWGWLVNPASGVSAHYVVNDDGSEVSQLVDEANRAWHIAATYDCANNHGERCDLNGTSSNTISVGIEHAGSASQTSWDEGLIQRSAELVCGITTRHGIPRDAYHIVAHGQLQPWNRTDPGPNWPWADYLRRVREACGDATPTGPTVVIDDATRSDDARFEASGCWVPDTFHSGWYGSGQRVGPSNTTRSDPASFRFRLDDGGCFSVEAWWTQGDDRSPNTPFIAFGPDGTKLGQWNADQRQGEGVWNLLGHARFGAGWNRVDVSRWVPAGTVAVADAVRIRPASDDLCP